MIRVLIVEDEPLIAEAHRAYTERLTGFEVAATVHTGRAALDTVAAAAAGPEPIDLVLLDLGLPDISGLEVAAAWQGAAGHPDVIVISSARDLSGVRAAVAHGVVLYLLKPFTFAAFADRMARYREYRTALPTGETAISQDDIDRALNVLRTPEQRASAPKGMQADTFAEVSRLAREKREGVTATEIASAVGVSRITAWRYLERMADDGLVGRHSEYGGAGRPRNRYRWR